MDLDRIARRSRWGWCAALLAVAVLAFAAAEVRGRASRRAFGPGPGAPRPWGTVAGVADAFRYWQAAGVRGRRLVLLTGRWARPRPAQVGQAGLPSGGPGARPPALDVDAASALFAAGKTGVVRRLDAVMPAEALERRLAGLSGEKALVREPGAFRAPYRGLLRRFSTPEAFASPDEPVLVLVEPSFFGPGTPPDPAAWLAARGVRADLALVALDDPAATDEQRDRARAFAAQVGAGPVEVAR